jgi:FtsP/CotA-like multicopper oxidase with cupredoxin domain
LDGERRTKARSYDRGRDFIRSPCDAQRGGHAPSQHQQHGGERLASAWAATGTQQAAVSGVANLLLLAGMIVSGFYVNLGLGAKDVGGLIMPKGMIMDFNTPADIMRDMSSIDPRKASYRAPPDARGDQILEPRIENGVKVFDIETSVIRWNILPNVSVEAYAFNRQVPGPRLQLVQGDRVRINVRNGLPKRPRCIGMG